MKSKSSHIAIVLIIITIFMIGCSKNGTTVDSTTTNDSITAEENENDHIGEVFKISVKDEETYTSLFDLKSHISIQIDISDEELKKIQEDYDNYSQMGSKSPIYRRADKVTITIGESVYEYEDVGIRMKGNTSRTDFYDESTGEVTNLCHWRLKFNETFDNADYYGDDTIQLTDDERKERKNRTFASLEALEIKWNKCLDNTYVREIYAHDMYRSFGVLAARCNLSTISMNNDKLGVWVVYEPIDDIFLERNLSGKDWGGDLYKGGWTYEPCDYTPKTTFGISDDDAAIFYNLDLKTNKKTSTYGTLKTFISTMNSKREKEDIEKVLNTENFAKFAALSYFTGNPDDYRNNYNNHYIYFLNSTNQAIFIPYDLDRCFGITYEYNPTGDAMTSSTPLSEYALGIGDTQKNPILNHTILNDSFLEKAYINNVSLILDSAWLDYEDFVDYYYTAKINYEGEVIPSKEFDNVDNSRLQFSLSGQNNGGSEYNMSVKDYMEGIIATCKNSLQ